jgi:hypothetical protein
MRGCALYWSNGPHQWITMGESIKAKSPRMRASRVLAEWTGLEPATPGVTGRYSNQLNYHSRLLFRCLKHCCGSGRSLQQNRCGVQLVYTERWRAEPAMRAELR